MVLFTASRGNTFVGGTCALLSALLVDLKLKTLILYYRFYSRSCYSSYMWLSAVIFYTFYVSNVLLRFWIVYVILYWNTAHVLVVNTSFSGFFCCAMLCKRDLCRHAVSVCPSVCLFVTFVYSVETNKDIFKMFSPSGSHNVSRRADCRNGDHCEIRICG